MPTYKTPDVYVEEISLFPPSVAEVATAIPAFIGYTEKAKKTVKDDLLLQPTEIYSMKEYEAYYGQPQAEPITLSVAEDASAPTGFTASDFKVNTAAGDPLPSYLLYYAVKMFFDNGGGKCYIVSVATYSSTSIAATDLQKGLAQIALEDEPTMLVVPEAVKLSNTADYSALVQAMLLQCGGPAPQGLHDRFSICDVLKGASALTSADLISNRGYFGNNYLSYGAAYYPFLKSTSNYYVNDAESNVTVTYTSVAGAASTAATAAALKAAQALASASQASLDAAAAAAAVAPDSTVTGTAKNSAAVAATDATAAAATATPASATAAQKAAASAAVAKASADASAQAALDAEAAVTANDPNATTLINTAATAATKANTDAAQAKTDATATKTAADNASTAATTAATASPSVTGPLNNFSATGTSANTAVYNFVKNALKEHFVKVPPSGAVAGVYAATDTNRGVWKAPANVSLAGVIEPLIRLDNAHQDNFNVDPTSGKSINALRQFAGKGTLVWGARTLDGNSNEWRYVNVRRFFIMVEESVKKSTYWAVFEPNDANTWVKVRSMIENYLTQKWREGALAGATTKDAFFVKCGLGTTMTAQDILEGRMNVEIGMAVVRPAEFIILKFSHKLQTP